MTPDDGGTQEEELSGVEAGVDDVGE